MFNSIKIIAVNSKTKQGLHCFVYIQPLKNITLSAEESLIERARQVASEQRTTLNAAFREWLKELTARQTSAQEYDALMERLNYFKVDRKFTREEMNERR